MGMTCRAASRWHSHGMRAAFAPVRVVVATAVALVVAGCGGPASPQEAVDNGPLVEYFAEALGTSDFNRAVWDEQQERISGCMGDAGFEYTPIPFENVTVTTFDPAGRTREEAEANGWGIIPLEALVDDSAPPEDPNQEYVASLSPSAGVQYEEAMRGPLDQDVEATTENLDAFGCWGRALKVQTETSPWFIGGFESLQAEMERRDEEIPLDPRYVAALADWGACMADAGHPGLESPDDARLSIEDALTTEFPSGFSEDDPRIIELAAQERELAVASFDCEESADLLTVYNQAQTDWETAFIANHEDEMDALVEAVKAARG